MRSSPWTATCKTIPGDIPRLLGELRRGADVASGWRRERRAPWVRRLPSWLANRLIARSTCLPLHDHGCGLKAYRRAVVRSLHLYVYAGRGVDDLVLSHLSLPLGDEPGLSTSAETLVFGSLALPAAVLLWWARSRWLEGPGLARVARVLGAALVLHSAAVLGWFLLEPRFEGREVRRALEAVLPDSASLAGDWAPFFALGTPHRAFYLGAHGHPPERIEEICPDYLLHSETDTAERSLRILTANPHVLVGDAVFAKRYAERAVSLHPLRYAGGPCARAPRPAPDAGAPSPSASPGESGSRG